MSMTKREKMDLEVAQMRLREAEERIQVLFGDAPTDTFANIDTSFKYHPLVPGATIKFVLPGSNNVIQVRIDGGWVNVRGNMMIEIVPQSSNVVLIRSGKEG